MVAKIDEKPSEIWTPTNDPQVVQLQKDIKEELMMFAKDAAIKLRCNPEELKFNVNANGVYNFQRMTPQEMDERKASDG